jgi:flagellar motility protein MotE (MotC chaperone)
MEEQEKESNKLLNFFYIFILPLLFTALLTGLLLTFMGYDIKEEVLGIGKNVPGLSSVIPDSESAKEKSQAAVEDYEKIIKEKEAELTALEEQLKKKILKIDEQTTEINNLHSEITALEEAFEEKKHTDEERKARLAELAKTYGGMSSSKAAAVFEQMTLHEAALLLNEMKDAQQSAILGKVEPALAADLTVILKEMYRSDDPEIAALQERIQVYTTAVESEAKQDSSLSIKEMANTFEKMPPAQAAVILENMSESTTEFSLGTKILTNMSEEQRSALLGAMEETAAAKYIGTLVN